MQLPRAKRVATNVQGMIYGADGNMITPCRLRNVSSSGAQLELARDLELPRTFLLSLSKKGEVIRRCTNIRRLSASGSRVAR